MINKIVMKNVASYKTEAVLETDKKVNLIYGLNGTGKSTLSGYLYDMMGEQYRECRVEGLGNTDKVLVYNQKFIADNFYETEEIQGIFTLSQKNKEVKKIVDEAKIKLKTLVENQVMIEQERKELGDKYQKQLLNFYKEVWKIKTEYTGGDRVLEYCLEGLKGKQETLFNYLVGISLDEDINYSVDELCKNAGGSSFVSMKYEEIQNDYQAYWQIIKDRSQAPALIANCMRNIIEYFFNFVEKLDFSQVFQKPELQDTRFLAFNRYMNRESHSKGQNIFDIKEFDYDSFKDAFKLVFEIEGYPEHYQKMMK